MGRPKKNKDVEQEILDKGKEAHKDFDDKNEIKIYKKKFELLQSLANEANKKYGKNTVIIASEHKNLGVIPTGNAYIDEMIGGIPKGKFSIFWGGPGTGKTTIILDIIANAQKLGLVCALVDAEASFDDNWAKKHGIDLEKLVILKGFNTAEEALDTVNELTKKHSVDLLIIDSLTCLSPNEEQQSSKGKEKSLADNQMALMPRVLSKFFRIITPQTYKANCAILLIGQTRTNLGGFIAFDSLTGGNALKHAASLILNFRRGAKADAPVKKIKNADGEIETKIIGFDSVITIDKTKMSESKQENSQLSIPFYFDSGFENKK